MAGKRDFVGELKAYVKRSALAAGKETTDLAWGRLSAILTAFEAATKNDDEKLCDELRRHIVVSLVAVIQGSARRTIAEIVDIKEEREEELPEPQDVRITIGMIRELKKREFSVGELIAHFSSLGGFEQLSSALQRVFGEDLNTIFLNACRAGTIQITGFENPEEALANTRAQLMKLFEYRNIYCHEEGVGVSVKDDELLDLIRATVTIVGALRLLSIQLSKR